MDDGGGSQPECAGRIDGADELNAALIITYGCRMPPACSLGGQFHCRSLDLSHTIADPGGGARIINTRGTGTSGQYEGWQLKIGGSSTNWNISASAIDDGAANYKSYTGSTTRSHNQWYQVVMVYEADTALRFYVNGALDVRVRLRLVATDYFQRFAHGDRGIPG